MNKNTLDELISKLYNARGNFVMCGDLKDFNESELQDLLDTPSKHKYLVKGGNPTNRGYITVKLTDLGIRYYENCFKFDRELEVKSINIGTIHNNGNFAIENNGTQSIEISNQIDDIIKLLEKKNFVNKNEVKLILEDFKNTGDKSSLEKSLNILAGTAGIGSLITSIISLIK